MRKQYTFVYQIRQIHSLNRKVLEEHEDVNDNRNKNKMKKKKNLNTTEFFQNQLDFLKYSIIQMENKQFAESIKLVLDIRVDFNGILMISPDRGRLMRVIR